ncbi:hypothetical protein BV22DRAFT_1016579 [Leucogyrophana mollusca]|uniref:Uncharacterized protein n=1 Tax=Leucogyrophana mollusca TaxID=85980 RepID=A0ACB8BDC8_9AGAM|nr:hypothetical protein BV22DRAFT_1016579 [Leucogyrophana mollusca]
MGLNLDTESIRRRKLSKPHKNVSDAEPRQPLPPVNGASEQESPKPKRFLGALPRTKKKKSMGTLHPPLIDVVPFPRELRPRGNSGAGAETDMLFVGAEDHDDKPSKVFEARDHFARRRGMMHHPYPHDEAPYMQAYDPILMENDRYTELLLRRLNPNGTPSFHKFAQNPPSTILDLGCGSGEWALDAATAWNQSQVIGLDLINPTQLREKLTTPKNLRWVQGNFVHYKLPFPKDSFDLVRMANLSLCIPYDRWFHVIREVRRVLAPGGHLELIDDQIFFPYDKPPPRSPTTPTVPRRRPPQFDSWLDDDDDEEYTSKSEDETDEDFKSTRTSMSSFNDTFDDKLLPETHPDYIYDPASEWESTSVRSKELESVFEQMLQRKYGIHPRPREVIELVLDKVFGRYNSNKLSSMHLALAPPSNKDTEKASATSTENGGKKKGLKHWVTTIEWDKDEKKEKVDKSSAESVTPASEVPDTISAKAAGRLGITPASTPPPRPAVAQSPGLVLWPYTFIPVPPVELEMHACKNLHALLGCKAALHEYLQDFKGPCDQPAISDATFDDLLWDYECFRRKRFNWPSEVPGYRMDELTSDVTTPKSAGFRAALEATRRPRGSSNDSITSKPLHPRDDLTFVRSIHVYSATKVDEDFAPA